MAEPSIDVHLSDLTERQKQVVHLVLEGLTNAQIGARLRIKEESVKSQMTEILRKAGKRNRTELAAWALEQGAKPTS